MPFLILTFLLPFLLLAEEPSAVWGQRSSCLLQVAQVNQSQTLRLQEQDKPIYFQPLGAVWTLHSAVWTFIL